ncbi:MAG: glycosyltransferase [Candidatus Sumerlaeia bacterium]|nr:glycosyltransferase [Candidatus Sumerlaeia bacterium]
MANPRVTLVGPVHPHRGGIAHYTACLAEAVQKSGCAVQVVSFVRLYPRFLFPGQSEFDVSREAAAFPSERVLAPLNPLRWMSALQAIKRFHPDLVVIAWWHSWFLPVTAFLLVWLRWVQRRRTVLLCHNVGSHDRKLVDGLAWRILCRLPEVHLVHASGDPARIRARNRRARIVCLPHPTYNLFSRSAISRDAARERLGLAPTARVCLMFGLVRRYKGVDIAIEAMARLRDQPDLRLIVAGEFYEPREPYQQQIECLGLAGKVLLHDRYIPNEEVATYFRAADVMLAPYREASHSGAVQTARGFHLPIIATRVGGMPDLVQDGETGLLVPPESPEALAAAIVRYFQENLGERFRANLAAQSARYSWSSLAETLRALATP